MLLLQNANSLAAALLLSLCTLAAVTDAAPLPHQHQHQPIERRSVSADVEGDIEIFKFKQPDTPPSSLPSDPFAKYTYEKTLTPANFRADPNRRTIIVGDVHGSFAGLEGFLKQVKFNPAKDTIILAGDILAKGPQSLQVIDKARSLNAHCVRGNHDDKVIRWKGYLNSLGKQETKDLEVDSESRPQVMDDENSPEYNSEYPDVKPFAQKKSIPSDLVENSEHHKIAKSLSDEQYQYLLSCSLILTLPKEISAKKVPIHVIHAGIDPKMALANQQPWVLVNVRNILDDGTPSRKKKEGAGWSDVFNSKKPGFMVVYGHDAGRALSTKPKSIGLDTGCVYGRALSGYVVETDQILKASCPDLGVGGGGDE
ncbi:hypothetical protein BGZ65_006176 [Modicella reniformis]|uniref:Calcineurin-like phosphoesterase domain-containing protein n=1 Tax=Modicella reniformis TaxID=1440133 RepID=A0A9P6MBU1_9FUNG|nr:hypothetical protein BGZ65_006176 [Modicella reniformis]